MSENPSKAYQASIMGKKIPQQGGNSPNAPKPPAQTGGNQPTSTQTKRQTNTGGNYTQGQKVP